MTLAPKKYSAELNVDWMVKGEISVATMGFFPRTTTTEKLIRSVGMLSIEILNGFQFVKTHVMRNPQLGIMPNSWALSQEMKSKGVFTLNPLQNLKRDLVFSKLFRIESARKWISELLKVPNENPSPPSKRKRKTAAADGEPSKRGKK